MFGRRRKPAESPTFPTDHAGEELRNEALVDAMRAVSIADSPESRALLYQLLLESNVVVMSPTATSEHRSWTAGVGEQLQLVTFADEDGSVLPVFTSVETLLRFRPDGAGYVALPAAALFQMAEAGGTAKLSIDPGSETSGYITRSEIEAMARGRLPLGGSDFVAQATEIRVGVPAVPPPDGVLESVRASLNQTPSVSRAWLTMIQQGALAAEVVIAVRLDESAGEDEMRVFVDHTGAATQSVGELRFMRADDAFAHTLDSGSGQVIFTR